MTDGHQPLPRPTLEEEVEASREQDRPKTDNGKPDQQHVGAAGMSINPPNNSAGATRTSGAGHGDASAHTVGTPWASHMSSHVASRMPIAGKTLATKLASCASPGFTPLLWQVPLARVLRFRIAPLSRRPLTS